MTRIGNGPHFSSFGENIWKIRSKKGMSIEEKISRIILEALLEIQKIATKVAAQLGKKSS
jgi:hypothetical protein